MMNLKKFFGALFLLTCFFIPQIVHAEKTDWLDNSFNFKGVKKIVVFDITYAVNLNDKGNAVIYKIRSDYLDRAMKKSKCQVITETQAQQILGSTDREFLRQNVQSIADAWAECKIKNWRDSYYIVPERTVWESKRMTRTATYDGSTWEEDYYITVPVTYPPYRVDVSDLAASFEIHDARTGNPIFVRDDVRSREDAEAQKDMFGRMCNSFFEDFGKRVR